MNYQDVNQYLWRYGYAFAPTVLAIKDLTGGHDGPIDSDGEPVEPPEDFLNLRENDEARTEMLRLAQEWRKDEYQAAALEALGRGAIIDGKPGPATYGMIEAPRCGCPDYAPPRAEIEEEAGPSGAIGSGPWKSCHSVGSFHSAHMKFTNAPPAHLTGQHTSGRTVFQEALRRTQQSYREIGLLLYFSGPGTGDLFLPPSADIVQSNCSFVGSSSGWIGLAIVGNNNMSCSSNPIWAQFLSRFAQSSSAESKAHAWHLLLAHEFGHNCGLGHTGGGIMNPSLNTSSNGRWVGDVAENWMKGRFGGIAVPDDGPGPGPGPEPPDDGEAPEWVKWLLSVVVWVIKNWPRKVKA